MTDTVKKAAWVHRVLGVEVPDQSGSSDGISIEELRVARKDWNEVRSRAENDIQRLKGILEGEYASDTFEQKALPGALQRLDTTINSMDEALGDRLDDVLNAESNVRSGPAKTARGVVERLLNFVASDKIMSLLDRNEYARDMVVAAHLRNKLEQIAQALG